MQKLKPCPFCGGEAYIVEGNYDSWEDGYAIRCSNCALTFGASGRIGETYEWMCVYKTEAEAIEAWNARHERTCTVTRLNVDRDGTHTTDYSCGCWNNEGWNHNYCPNCGAKVVGDI